MVQLARLQDLKQSWNSQVGPSVANKAISAQPTEVGVGLSWAELGNIQILLYTPDWYDVKGMSYRHFVIQMENYIMGHSSWNSQATHSARFQLCLLKIQISNIGFTALISLNVDIQYLLSVLHPLCVWIIVSWYYNWYNIAGTGCCCFLINTAYNPHHYQYLTTWAWLSSS